MIDLSLSLELMTLLLVVGVVAGWVDAIAGGGGMITIPALLLTGMPPATALATNKLQGSIGSLTASLFFIRRGMVDLSSFKWAIAATFLGSVLGAWCVLQIDAQQLMLYLPALLLCIAVYFWLSPSVSDKDRRPRISMALFAALACTGLGFYDGFFGPGTGSMMALACVALLGYRAAKATAHAKVINFASNFGSLLFFIAFGDIHWLAGALMIAGQLIGANLGARMVLSKGSKLIRPIVVGVCILMSLNILWRNL